ncbi:hypothetical protein Scep_023287 [Stephania cephalantha]|uniref:Transcriptional coactivator Hfi1/Transcriptional adapter 1 n=1 Tax=Stephania cephalantha TaxID=152367 RepID=A0AAP0EZT4_9MAGN
MQSSSQQLQRINLSELKAQLVKKLGPERSRRYFDYLSRLLSQKLSKGEFDKLCLRVLGRENLPLHNQLIRSILKNAYHAKVPPPLHEKGSPSKVIAGVKKTSPPGEDGYQHIGASPIMGPTSLIWSNGDVLPMSPRKSRSRDRRVRDRPSPLGPNGKTDFSSHPSNAPDDVTLKVISENGDANSCDFKRPVQHQQGIAEQPDRDQDALLPLPMKRSRTKKSPDNLVSVHSKDHIEVVVVEDGEEVEQGDNSDATRSPLRAPLGIPFCSASVGGSRRSLPAASSSGNFATFSDSGELFDSETLRKRIEQIAGAHGLEVTSNDCANLLNNGLDVYLKQLIRSCVDLVGVRSGQEPAKQLVHKQQPHGKLMNGMWPSHQLQMQNSGGLAESMQEPRSHCPISLLDFKVAMQLNPQQLGEDWPLLLEKISTHESEE